MRLQAKSIQITKGEAEKARPGSCILDDGFLPRKQCSVAWCLEAQVIRNASWLACLKLARHPQTLLELGYL